MSNPSNVALFTQAPAVDSAGNLTFTLAPDANGFTTFYVQVQDDGGTANGGIDMSGSQMFWITVYQVNDAPDFTASNISVNEDDGSITIPNWATFNPGGGGDESSQLPTYIVTNIADPSLFTQLPFIDSAGELTFTLAADATGSCTFGVQVQDNGGIDRGGIDMSGVRTFTITVNPVNDAPTFTVGGDVTVNEDSGAYSAAWAANVSTGPANEGQTAKADVFEAPGAEPASAWRNQIVALVCARANLYEQTAPAPIINTLAPALRASAAAAQAFLTGAGVGLPAADRTLLNGLAAESNVQADLLQASAENTSHAFTQGLLLQFRDLAVRYLGNVEFEAQPQRDTLGNRSTTRPPGYQLWLDRVDQILYMLRGTARDFSPHTLYGARSALALSTATYNSHGPAITYSAAVAQLTTGMPRLAELLNAYTRISFGFTNGNNTEFAGGKADIIATLNAAGMNTLAANYVRQFIADFRSQQALQMAYRLQQEQENLQWWANAPVNIANAARTFAIGLAQELPVILVSSALSGGSVGIALSMWRVATGVRLAARTVRALNVAASIPISQAVDRALGRAVDDSFLGTMKQGGMMVGTQVGFSILASVGRRAIAVLRAGLANVQPSVIPPGSGTSYGSIIQRGNRLFAGAPTIQAGDFELFGQVTSSVAARDRLRQFARTVFGRELPDNVQMMMVGGGFQFHGTAGSITNRVVAGGTVVASRRAIIFLKQAGLDNPVLLADEIGHLVTGRYLRKLGQSNWHNRVSFRMLDRAARRGDVQLTAAQQAELQIAIQSASIGN